MCEFRHKLASIEVINMWVDSEKIADKCELTVKEEGKSDPMGSTRLRRWSLKGESERIGHQNKTGRVRSIQQQAR